MTGSEVVGRFWDRIEARDWDAAGALLAEDAVFFVASIFDVRHGVITGAVEYWVEAGHEAPPDRRRRFTES